MNAVNTRQQRETIVPDIINILVAMSYMGFYLYPLHDLLV